MSIGPFDPLAFPGVYTQTQNQPSTASAGVGARIPAFIGVANEVLPVTAWEMIRGSSPLADNKIIQEDVTDTGVTDPADPNYGRRYQVTFYPIVSGNGTGTTTTDPSKITTYVNGIPVPVASLDGANGYLYLVSPTIAGDKIQVTYYYKRTDSNMYDILPSNEITEITKVGYSTTSSDFINGTDFLLDAGTPFSTINWGNGAQVAYGVHTPGDTYFGPPGTQITADASDNRLYRLLATPAPDGTNKSFVLTAIPTNSAGRSTDVTSAINVWVGTSPADATNWDSTVVSLSGTSKTVTLSAAPAAGQYVYVTQSENLLTSDVWTLKDVTSGVTGVGVYSMTGAETGAAWDVAWSSSDSSVNVSVNGVGKIQYPSGIGYEESDAQILPGVAGVGSLITLTFANANSYIVTSDSSTGTGLDNTGYLNQTYVDQKTGFKVTLVTPDSGAYIASDKVCYKPSSNFVTSATAKLAIPSMHLTVTDTAGVGVGDTAIVTTLRISGNTPKVGDFYYASFNQEKNFDAITGLSDPIYVTLEKDAVAYTGPLSVQNKLGLAAHLAFLNGAPGVILSQIKKSTGGADAPTSEYVAAIDVFNQPMVGGLKPALLEPVTTSMDVLSYLKTSNTIQSSIRYGNERMTYFGFPVGTTPSAAMGVAQAMNSERMIGIYPDGAIVAITDSQGNTLDYLVDGSFLAAAVAGRDTIPSYDVAEPLTRKPVAGFTRLYRRPDPVTQSQVANSGLTILEEQPAGVIVKMDLTTDVSSPLTRTPSIIRVKDYVQQGARSACGAYIGTKFLAARTTEIETTLKSYLSSLVKGQIINTFRDVKATPNPNDPSTVNVVAYYMPVFPLLWILITFNLMSSNS